MKLHNSLVSCLNICLVCFSFLEVEECLLVLHLKFLSSMKSESPSSSEISIKVDFPLFLAAAFLVDLRGKACGFTCLPSITDFTSSASSSPSSTLKFLKIVVRNKEYGRLAPLVEEAQSAVYLIIIFGKERGVIWIKQYNISVSI